MAILAESVHQLYDGGVQIIYSPFYQDLISSLTAHLFLSNGFNTELHLEEVVVGTGLAGGVDLQDLVVMDRPTVLSLARNAEATGQQPNLSHGYLLVRVNFEIHGAIANIDFKSTEAYIRAHLQNLIWNRDGLTVLEAKLSVPELEVMRMAASTMVADDSNTDSVLGGDPSKMLAVLTISEGERMAILLLFISIVGYIMSAVIYWFLFIEMSIGEPAETLNFQSAFCCCNRAPHSHYLLALGKRPDTDQGFFYYWFRYHISLFCCPIYGATYLQMNFLVQSESLQRINVVPPPRPYAGYGAKNIERVSRFLLLLRSFQTGFQRLVDRRVATVLGRRQVLPSKAVVAVRKISAEEESSSASSSSSASLDSDGEPKPKKVPKKKDLQITIPDEILKEKSNVTPPKLTYYEWAMKGLVPPPKMPVQKYDQSFFDWLRDVARELFKRKTLVAYQLNVLEFLY